MDAWTVHEGMGEHYQREQVCFNTALSWLAELLEVPRLLESCTATHPAHSRRQLRPHNPPLTA